MNRLGDGGEVQAGSRLEMVNRQLRARGIGDELVLGAMEQVPRHVFVPDELKRLAYSDAPLPIGEDQTISQPYIVAFMTEALELSAGDKVLEIGTGSGYQTAVLASMGLRVYTMEYLENLARKARACLEVLGYPGIHYRVGDGHGGWPEEAPFDGIIVTAAPVDPPQALIDQLAVGGRMIIPVGRWEQVLMEYQKEQDGAITSNRLLPVRFVPLVHGT